MGPTPRLRPPLVSYLPVTTALSPLTSTSATQRESSGFYPERAGGLELIVHTAAQPSHDWAALQPHTDFEVNALGTLNLLEATRRATAPT